MVDNSVFMNDTKLNNAIQMRKRIESRKKEINNTFYDNNEYIMGENEYNNDSSLITMFNILLEHITEIHKSGLNPIRTSYLDEQRDIIMGELVKLKQRL
uniref:Uncharacterized protein n=1 Tax=viral metagenome TaxID=1070528 RepID=A0A6C0BU30_9ZZZZ